MVNNITLDSKSFQFNESFLPCLVTGACKSGASYFSVSLIANLINDGSKVIFFTAFPMAKEELIHQIGNKEIFEIIDEKQIQNISQDKSIIIQSGNKNLWGKVVKSINNISDYVIFVKNIEEYDKSILDVIGKNEKIIFSGDLDNCNFIDELIEKSWKSKIIFTVPKADLKIEIPKLEKYESYLVNNNFKGILKIE